MKGLVGVRVTKRKKKEFCVFEFQCAYRGTSA
jgi:hypothetical protein